MSALVVRVLVVIASVKVPPQILLWVGSKQMFNTVLNGLLSEWCLNPSDFTIIVILFRQRVSNTLPAGPSKITIEYWIDWWIRKAIPPPIPHLYLDLVWPCNAYLVKCPHPMFISGPFSVGTCAYQLQLWKYREAIQQAIQQDAYHKDVRRRGWFDIIKHFPDFCYCRSFHFNYQQLIR